MYFLRTTTKRILKKLSKRLDKHFPDLGVLDKDESTPGKFVLSTLEIDKDIREADSVGRVNAGAWDEYLPKEENANQIFTDAKEKEIAEAWRAEKANRGPLSPTKEAWAKAVHGINAKQVPRYEKKYPPE